MEETKTKERKKKKISSIISIRLFVAVLVAFVISCLLTYFLLYIYCLGNARDLLQFSSMSMLVDVKSETEYGIAEMDFRQYPSIFFEEGGEEALEEFLAPTRYTYMVRQDGTIFRSGDESFLGKNVRDIEYVGENIDFIFTNWKDKGYERNTAMTPIPVKTLDGERDVYYLVCLDWSHPDSILVIAVPTEYYIEKTAYIAAANSSNQKVGKSGFQFVVDRNNTIVTYRQDIYLQEFPDLELIKRCNDDNDKDLFLGTIPVYFNDTLVDMDVRMLNGRADFWGTEYLYCLNRQYDDYYFASLYPVEEAFAEADETIAFIIVIEIIVFAVLFIVLNRLIKRRVVNKLDIVNETLDKITAGDLEQRVEVRDSKEFDLLSTDINATVDRLKGYIAEAAARIDADLAVAKAIQSSVLPSVFPPFPEHKEFELFASMNAAKEVGGDFYDFFMLNDNTLGFLIADVSGKSIPGAMFMMTSKTLIHNLAESGMPPAEVFTTANEKLCEGNDAEMFVTAWMGYLDLKPGLLRIANAVHNPPVLIHDGIAEYVILKPGLMLAGMDGVQYKEQTLQLQKGDILYIYTDGVTEAMDRDEEQYGEGRLKNLLSFGGNTPEPSGNNGVAGAVCDMVIADVVRFTDGAEQSDDITMLCIRYLGGE